MSIVVPLLSRDELHIVQIFQHLSNVIWSTSITHPLHHVPMVVDVQGELLHYHFRSILLIRIESCGFY